MEADNLVQFPKWEGWKEIFNTVPIAIFDRPTYSSRALAGKRGDYGLPTAECGERRFRSRSTSAFLGILTLSAQSGLRDGIELRIPTECMINDC